MDLQQAEELLFSDTSSDFEKAVAQVGETRQWADGTYRKVENGKWVKLSNNNKERAVASSGMNKIFKEIFESLEARKEKIRKEFEEEFKSKYSGSSKLFKSAFDYAWGNEVAQNEFIKRILAEQKDISDEIREIKQRLKQEQKDKADKKYQSEKQLRERAANKKELDENDIRRLLAATSVSYQKIVDTIPAFGNAKQIMPEVTIDDYYLDTETTYNSILSGKEDGIEEIEQRWNDMKDSGKYQYHKSPKSSSEYLIDAKTGDVYRFSDHWGKVASCSWHIESKSDEKWDIAKSNIKDFERKETGVYYNPLRRTAILKWAKSRIKQMNALTTENDKFYLGDGAIKALRNRANFILNSVEHDTGLNIEQAKELRKKYEKMIEF